MTAVTAEAEDTVAALRGHIGDARGEIQTLLTAGTTLANDADWSGVDADRWREDWEDIVRPTLEVVGDQLDTVADTTERIIGNIFTAGGRR